MSDTPMLEYGSKRPGRRWLLLCIAVALLLAVGALVMIYGSLISRRAQALLSYRSVLAGAASIGTLDLSVPAAGDSLDPSSQSSLYQRISTWSRRNDATRAALANLISPSPFNYTGDPGTMLIWSVRTSDRQERLIAIGANTLCVPERSLLLLRFNVELFTVGSYLSPTFAPVKAKAARDLRQFTPGVYDSFRWLCVDVRFTPGDTILLGGPVIRPTDPATVVFPISVRGETDELLITLEPGDQINVRRASGKAGRFDVQPTTTPSAA